MRQRRGSDGQGAIVRQPEQQWQAALSEGGVQDGIMRPCARREVSEQPAGQHQLQAGLSTHRQGTPLTSRALHSLTGRITPLLFCRTLISRVCGLRHTRDCSHEGEGGEEVGF